VCEQGDVRKVVLTDKKTWVNVDSCIVDVVTALNQGGVQTVASCCGHGHRPGNIALADGRELVVCPNYETGRVMDKMLPNIQGERSIIQHLITTVSKMMLCFPEVIEEGSIDEDFTLPYLIVDEVREAMKRYKGASND